MSTADNITKNLTSRSSEYFRKRGEQMALQLFRDMARRVPAYRKFLRTHGITPQSVRAYRDLKTVPAIDKANYLRAYPLRELCWDGAFARGQNNISATSGSTGEPFYFPRTIEQDRQYALLADHYLRQNFSAHKRTTLYINAFPMGVWIGGVFTYATIRLIAEEKHYPLSIINPGISKVEVIRAIKKFSGEFDQIIIGAYAPFLKDIIDDGEQAGINWRSIRLGFVFSAEGFSEEFRDYIVNATGVDPIFGTLNHYGTVDLGTMSYETPLAIAVRRIARENRAFARRLFGTTGKVPTLTQFIPELFNFEEINGGLYASARSGIPLVRYDLKDSGNVFTYERMLEIGGEAGLDILREVKLLGVKPGVISKLPFVQVFERKDFSVSFYAFQIYPEMIRRALLSMRSKDVTGKFALFSTYTRLGRPVLEVHVELRPGGRSGFVQKKHATECITKTLIRESSEYRETWSHKGATVAPKVVFHRYEDPKYFKPGGKQKWVI